MQNITVKTTFLFLGSQLKWALVINIFLLICVSFFKMQHIAFGYQLSSKLLIASLIITGLLLLLNSSKIFFKVFKNKL
jgi:hypothetical protein